MGAVTAAAYAALACVLLACTAGMAAADAQFHIITEDGNTFIVSPPDLPRPANIMGETAHLAVRNPPAGMFVASAPNHTMHKFVPLQSGLDAAGFSGGVIRVILESDWAAGADHAFRDQPFGTMAGSPMHHAAAMPASPGWNASYGRVYLDDDSRFGMPPDAGRGNRLGLSAGTNGEYTLHMSSRNRAGLDFGPGSGTDQTYYIYRGCTACNADAVVGHGDAPDDRSMLPNGSPVDHDRGWLSISGCDASAGRSWSGTGTRTVSATYSVPAPAHSRAGDHYTDSRYGDLSVMPNSHTACTLSLYTEITEDNRKHDMCVSSASSSASTKYRYPYTKTVERYAVDPDTKTITYLGKTTSSGAATRTTHGGCNTPSTSSTSDGYRVSASCWGGPSPSNPPQDRTVWSSSPTSITVTAYDYSSPSETTTGRVGASCSLSTNTPHLNLDDAMSLRPGLNVYRPPPIPTSHDVIVILDDTERGGGSTERIQVYRRDGGGGGPAGPFDFHLRPPVSGVLYDAHRHYGWLDTRLYGAGMLGALGYTEHAAMVGYGDGLLYDGSPPYADGRRLCHGDCLMGQEGMDSTGPRIREVTPSAIRPVSGMVSGLVYDHANNRWFDSAFTGSRNQVVASSLYLVVPFAEDASIRHVAMFGSGFDPASQNPPPRVDPALQRPCHLAQPDQLHAFAASLNVTRGGSLEIPILPEVRYVAFIGNGHCHWYDVAALPSPLSSVSSGARAVPLADGTILSGDLTARHAGVVHVDVVADVTGVWQSEMYGLSELSLDGNATWVVPPLGVNVTAVARVNGAPGHCGSHNVYCSDVVVMSGVSHKRGSYIHGIPVVHATGEQFVHGEPYAQRPRGALIGGETGFGVYALDDGRCYGLAAVEAGTGGITVRSIPGIRVSAGDTITLEFHAAVSYPTVVGGNVTTNMPGHVCRIVHTEQSSVLDITTMTATLR